jgi:hypothetical protein
MPGLMARDGGIGIVVPRQGVGSGWPVILALELVLHRCTGSQHGR